MIKLVAKKKLAFRNPAATGSSNKYFTVTPYAFVDAPEWITGDPMYKWALEAGVIEVSGGDISDKKPTKKAKAETEKV